MPSPRKIADANHPIWPLARLSILLVALTILLYLTAHRFDETEIITICSMFLAAASVEGGIRAARAALNTLSPPSDTRDSQSNTTDQQTET